MKVAVLGAGAVGARAVRQLTTTPEVTSVAVADIDGARADACVASMDDAERVRRVEPDEHWAAGADAAVLAVPPGDHRSRAERLLEQATPVVSTSDGQDDVHGLLALDAEARERTLPVAVAAAFAPGLTDLLAAHAATGFDVVDEVHVAKIGTGGPACARSHHDALRGEGDDWRDGAWVRRRAGSGRELCWFPDPVGAADCYRAAVPDAQLLVPAFAGVQRVTGRVGANRRDRLTSWLPMLRPPHPEGETGAVRVEVRGRRGSVRDTVVLGALDRPGVAAGTVAALAAVWAASGRLRPGAGGLAQLADPLPLLLELARRGVRAALFEGARQAV